LALPSISFEKRGRDLKRGWILLAVCAGALAIGIVVVVLVGFRCHDYSPRQGPPTLEEDTRRLEAELPLAASRKPYLVLDLLTSRLIYRISGFTPKTIPFRIDSIRGPRGLQALAREGLWLAALQERGAPRELIQPPDPTKPADPLKDPKIFPPDPPTDYVLSFDRPFEIHIVGERGEGWRERLGTLTNALGRWMGKKRGKEEVRIQLRLPAGKAQEIYRALYRGEQVLVLGVNGPAPAVQPSSR
jgi:hypothetical protein